MPSPFPGMNPYLEQDDAWEDFHNSFIVAARNALAPQLGEYYYVKVEPRLFIHELSEDERRFFGKADVGVSRENGYSPRPASSGTVLAAPVRLQLPTVVEERSSALEVRDKRDRRVVTVIELLSPSNKTPGKDYEPYNAKRHAMLHSETHFVEIDLRRGGKRPYPPQLPPCDYYALVSRFGEYPRMAEVWPLALRDVLPLIPIPLREPDPDVTLDLQEVLHRTYDAAGYGKYIYRDTPEPPLSAEDIAWARQFVPSMD